jgi:hypothetical protein
MGRRSIRSRAYLPFVQDWVLAAITGATGIFGALIGGGATYYAQRAERLDRERDNHAAALVALLHALDALHLEFGFLPRSTKFAAAVNTQVERRFPTLDFLNAQLSRAFFGRKVYAAIDRFVEAGNRVTLILPDAHLLSELEQLMTLVGRVDDRDSTAWADSWTQHRAALQVAARRVLERGPRLVDTGVSKSPGVLRG